jgi:hypothetical protein
MPRAARLLHPNDSPSIRPPFGGEASPVMLVS